MDRDKAVRDGRITQYELWNKDEAGLKIQNDRSVLYINEDSTLTVSDKHNLLRVMCEHVDQINLVDELSLFNGDKAFSFYRANRLINEPSNRAQPCPFPPRAWIDFPTEDDVLSGVVNVSGWAYNEDIGIDSVELIIDGAVVGKANYGAPRPDVVAAMDIKTDPNAPHLGFNIEVDSSTLENGKTDHAIDLINKQGSRTRYGQRLIRILN